MVLPTAALLGSKDLSIQLGPCRPMVLASPPKRHSISFHGNLPHYQFDRSKDIEKR